MKSLIKIEEAAITVISVYFLTRYNLGLSFWVWIPLFFAPDIAMIGYFGGTRLGAVFYNLVHHRAVGPALAGIGLLISKDIFLSVGILLFAHSSFDRMMGYGLKYDDNFRHTHLGWMGKAGKETAPEQLG